MRIGDGRLALSQSEPSLSSVGGGCGAPEADFAWNCRFFRHSIYNRATKSRFFSHRSLPRQHTPSNYNAVYNYSKHFLACQGVFSFFWHVFLLFLPHLGSDLGKSPKNETKISKLFSQKLLLFREECGIICYCMNECGGAPSQASSFGVYIHK